MHESLNICATKNGCNNPILKVYFKVNMERNGNETKSNDNGSNQPKGAMQKLKLNSLLITLTYMFY